MFRGRASGLVCAGLSDCVGELLSYFFVHRFLKQTFPAHDLYRSDLQRLQFEAIHETSLVHLASLAGGALTVQLKLVEVLGLLHAPVSRTGYNICIF